MKTNKFSLVCAIVFGIIGIGLFITLAYLKWTVGIDMTDQRFFLTYPWWHVTEWISWIACYCGVRKL